VITFVEACKLNARAWRTECPWPRTSSGRARCGRACASAPTLDSLTCAVGAALSQSLPAVRAGAVLGQGWRGSGGTARGESTGSVAARSSPDRWSPAPRDGWRQEVHRQRHAPPADGRPAGIPKKSANATQSTVPGRFDSAREASPARQAYPLGTSRAAGGQPCGRLASQRSSIGLPEARMLVMPSHAAFTMVAIPLRRARERPLRERLGADLQLGL